MVRALIKTHNNTINKTIQLTVYGKCYLVSIACNLSMKLPYLLLQRFLYIFQTPITILVSRSHILGDRNMEDC